MIAAQSLCRYKENKTINAIEYALELNTYRFRDLNGIYWFLNPLKAQWYDFRDKQWCFKDTVPNIFEAPDIPAFLADNENIIVEETKHEKSTEKGPVTALVVLAVVVEKIRSGFEDGIFSSTDVQRLLAQQVIIDLDGIFWTIGIQSREWYCFKDRQWNKSSISPPEEDHLFQYKHNEHRCYVCKKVFNDENICPHCGSKEVYGKDKPPEKVRSALADFLLFGATHLPEQITEPWESPLSFPNNVVNTVQKDQSHQKVTVPRCSECNAQIVDGIKFCTSCGAKTSDKPSKLTCPECAAEITKDLSFCVECGEKLH